MGSVELRVLSGDNERPAAPSGLRSPAQAASSATMPIFVGRGRVCAQLDQLVAGAADTGGSLLILGEPGIGKTALLARVVQTSPNPVLSVRGRESESVLPYAVAADLLTPLFDRHSRALPAVQRRALEVALAIGEGPPAANLAICAGSLSLLSAAADDEPLVVLGDDLQWMDVESRQLLLFVARRVAGERLVVIFAARDDPSSPGQDLPVIRLTGLTLAECTDLAEAHHVRTSAGRLQRVVATTGGNPLAVLEALKQRDPGAGETDSFDRLGAVQQAWSAVLENLPARTRRALFVLAAARGPGLPGPRVVLEKFGLSFGDLAPAEYQGLIGDDDRTGLDLRHPLLRKVLIDATPIAARSEVYGALATIADDDQRPWFLSKATIGPDPVIAGQLDDAALDARARGGHSVAARMLKRSAELTEAPAGRAQRLLRAAIEALVSGDTAHAEEWSGEAVALAPDPDLLARATLVRGLALSWMGHPRKAFEDLTRVAGALQNTHPYVAAELLCASTMPGEMVGDVHVCVDAAERARTLHHDAGTAPSFQAEVLQVKALVLAGRVAGDHPALAAACDRIGDIDPVHDQEWLAALAQCHTWAEDFTTARSLCNAVVDTARAQAAPLVLAFSLAVRAELETWAGRWAEARTDAHESLHWSAEMGRRGFTGYSLVTLARLEAALGQRDLTQQHIARCRAEVGSFGIDSLIIYEAAVLGLDSLSAGDHSSARHHLELAWQQAMTGGLGNALTVPFAADLAEARFRCGDLDGAAVPIDWLRARGEAGSAYAAAVADRCAALITDDPAKAKTMFAAARKALEQMPIPFELARTLLCEGEVLRRGRRVCAAREALRRAERIFESLGATPWTERARSELAAAGVRTSGGAVPPPSPDLDQLTAQELQIARMIARGRNNAEAAHALFVSRKTVEAHLTRIYRKLQIRSRTELAAVLLGRGHGTTWGGVHPGDDSTAPVSSSS